jgi:hypothetical protein
LSINLNPEPVHDGDPDWTRKTLLSLDVRYTLIDV